MAAAFTLTDVSLHYSEKQLLSHILSLIHI